MILFTISIFAFLITSCARQTGVLSDKNASKEEETTFSVDYNPKPAIAENAVGFRLKSKIPLEKAVLEISKNSEFKKTMVMKRENPMTFSCVLISPPSGVYKITVYTAQKNEKLKPVKSKLPSLHVVSTRKVATNPRKLIYDYLKSYYSLLPSNYQEIKITDVELIKRTPDTSIYRVSFEAKKFEEGREKELKTMFFVIKKGVGGLYVESATQSLPPSY